MDDIKIRIGTYPERYATMIGKHMVILQVDEEGEGIIIGKLVADERNKTPIDEVLFEGTFEEFNDKYNCSENGTYDFLLGFKMFIKTLKT